jgi:cytochrome b
MAASFIASYLTAESEYWRLVHIYTGYLLGVALLFRAIWGWLGPATAKFSILTRRLGMWPMWLAKIKNNEWQTHAFWVGASGWLLSFIVVFIYAFCIFSVTSGVLYYNDILSDGVIKDAMEELHEVFSNFAFFMILLHVSMIIALRVWRGPKAIRPMWSGRHKN